ncbi:MAG: glycosyltransferase family 2 protein [Candidatus Altiarchaeota archaeon]|nr:glycosyltransferase family 2 protein [Candidatus Altiarchaeota archaeon]
MKGTDVSVVIPTLNEEASIGRVIAEIREALDKRKTGYEIIVVDNNSTDRTSEIAQKSGARLIFEGNMGYGLAYKAGLAAAQGDVIVTGDADCTYPFDEISRFVDAASADRNAFIIANRFVRLMPDGIRPLNILGNHMLTFGMRLIYGIKISDSQSGMWAFNREFLDKINLSQMSDKMPFSQEMKLCAAFSGLRIVELPIRYRKRSGVAKLSPLRDGWDNLKSLITFRSTLSRVLKKHENKNITNIEPR